MNGRDEIGIITHLKSAGPDIMVDLCRAPFLKQGFRKGLPVKPLDNDGPEGIPIIIDEGESERIVGRRS